MNKTELIKKIAEKTGLSQAASKEALDAIQGALKKGDSVQLIGFGTFSVQKRAARTGKNPMTGAAIKIPAKKVAKWKASSSLL